MQGTISSLSLAKSIKKPFFSNKGAWGGILPSLEPRNPGNEEFGNVRSTIAEEKAAEPIVAFSRPPPFPPVLGPLVALSLLDSWSRRDNKDA